VPGLFSEEEKDGLVQPLDEELRKVKLPETKEFRWNYFVGKARENLYVVLAMSPADENLRVHCRNFPSLISNTNVDWFSHGQKMHLQQSQIILREQLN
jgi:dynein heavy chain